MQVELNIEKSPFCTIGPYSFTYGHPEHKVNTDKLTPEYKKQLLYNLRRDILRTEDKEAMTGLIDDPTPQGPALVAVLPVSPDDVAESMEDIVGKNTRVLKKILLGTIPSVKKEAAIMRLGNLRKLRELEEKGKNRKRLLDIFSKHLEIHTTEVMEAKGNEDLESIDMVSVSNLSTQLTNVVISEEEQITIPQEVLNRIKKPGV